MGAVADQATSERVELLWLCQTNFVCPLRECPGLELADADAKMLDALLSDS